MPSGLVALLDDVAVIARAAAASMDDVAAGVAKAGTKAAGVVIDDAAVTPGYVTGLTPDRELPIIWKITKGSLFNKLVILLPVALLLSAFLPMAITPILMAGGLYLAFEGAEKVLEKLGGEKHGETLDDPVSDVTTFEKTRVAGAIRTDLILSAEIMAIALSQVEDSSFIARAVALAVVGILITIGVYGAVALIVKMDDIGLHLSRGKSKGLRGFGRGLVKAMPWTMEALTMIGTAAMLWVGGGIIVHGLEKFHLTPIPHWVEGFSHWAGQVPGVGALTGWLAFALGSAVVGLVIGGVLAGVMHLWHHRKGAASH
jgi:predicted DNA repair protein MutK